MKRTMVETLTRLQPLFEPGSRVRVPKQITVGAQVIDIEGERVLIVGREWGPDVKVRASTDQSVVGWTYLCKIEEKWDPKNIREAFYIPESKLKEWNKPEKLNGKR